LLELMRRMGDEAAKIEQRWDVVAGARDGMRTGITKKARETKAEIGSLSVWPRRRSGPGGAVAL
jgi:hypothetical protein